MSEPVAPSAAPQPVVSEPVDQGSPSNAGMSADLNSQVDEAISAGASPQEVKKLVKEYKLKIGGKEVVKKYNSDDELIRDLQIGEANKNGMSKARELEKLFEKELNRLKSNPWEVLQELGHDPYALSEEKLNEWVEQQKKTPEQRQFEQMQKELQEARAAAKKRDEDLETMKFEKLKNEASKQITEDIETTLAGNPNLPKSGKTIGRIVDALTWAYDNGFPEATVKDVIPMVEADIMKEQQEFFANMDEGLFEKYIGQKNIERFRKKRIAQMRQTNAAEVQQVSKPKTEQIKEKVAAKDFFKNPLKYTK